MSRRSPWSFVPSLYVNQGLQYFVVQAAANLYLAALGFDLSTIGRLTNDLTLPWTFKALWSPLVDLVGSKRTWQIASALATSLALGFVSWAMLQPDTLHWLTIACLVLALVAATNDIATDGFYLLALDPRQQEFFVGLRNTFFRLGRIAVMGGAVALAGVLQSARGLSAPQAWSCAIAAAAALHLVCTLWNLFALPRPDGDGPARARGAQAVARAPFVESVRSFFTRPGIVGFLAFVLLYRAAESMLTSMIGPFLLASHERGGLGLTTAQVGQAYGTVGVVALLVGGVAGGFLIARFGLGRCLWPLALAMHAPNVLYAWAAAAQPGLGATTAVIAIEQLGYGLGFAAYMAALLAVARRSSFATTHYALATGFMAGSAWLCGRYSGDLAQALGFEGFFWLVSAGGIVGLATLPLLPRDARERAASTPA